MDCRWTGDRCVRAEKEFGLKSSDGIPFVSPEVVLLHKATSNAFDEQDADDFRAALPKMDESQCLWLSESLSHFDDQHPWIQILLETVKGLATGQALQ